MSSIFSNPARGQAQKRLSANAAINALLWRFLLILMVLLLPAAEAAEPENGLKQVNLNVGFIKSCFLNVNRADSEGAFRILTETVGSKHGYHVISQTQIFETGKEIEAAIKSGAINLAIIDSWRFLAMDIRGEMKPYFVTSEQGQVGKKYLLLTRRDSGLKTIADLRGKDIVELEVANSNAGKAWLDTLLLKNHFRDQTNFFAEVSFAAKPALAVLPVFFGKKPVCLVDHFSFDLMRELNPQVGKDLQVVASSEPYVDNVLCLSNAGWESEKAKLDFAEAISTLHLEPAGQQILTLFKVGPMVPFQESQLDTVKQLRTEYETLQKEVKP